MFPRLFEPFSARPLTACNRIVMPSIGDRRINTPQIVEEIPKEDRVDLVVASHAQLAGPDLCNKAHEGRTDSIVSCASCNQSCLDGFVGI